jgi:hypothetical protein
MINFRVTTGQVMNAAKIRKLSFLFACGVLAFAAMNVRADLSPGQARKALTRIPGFELKGSAVRVKSISSSTAAAADVTAEIRTVFKFATDGEGKWRVAEIRTGQDRWDDVDLIATALKLQVVKDDCTVPDPPVRGRTLVDPSVKRARCLLGSLLGVAVPSDAVRIQEVAPMPIPFASQPSATVVAWVRVDARLVTDKSGWRVAELRTGNRDWVSLEPLAAAVNEVKQEHARAELASIAAALEKFRADRGFYVVSDNYAVVIDYLSPRYLARIIRLDPWHRPYRYQGESDHFTLRSAGPDGKPDTPDDFELGGAAR